MDALDLERKTNANFARCLVAGDFNTRIHIPLRIAVLEGRQ